jgi:Porin subfamily
MKMIKSLVLGSAAGLLAMGGAQAADLPVKAKAVEYVKVCSLYGAGFFYIPGTDTCIKLGGYLRADVVWNTNNDYGFLSNPGSQTTGAQNRLSNYWTSRARFSMDWDTRTATEYGVVRTFATILTSYTNNSVIGSASGATSSDSATVNGGTGTTSQGIYQAFIQFAGFTIGRAYSIFDAPWQGYPAGGPDTLPGASNHVTGVDQLTYTASFGNGVSGSISLEDPQDKDTAGITNLSNITSAGLVTGSYGTATLGGTRSPDIIGQVRVDQAWGLAQFAVAAHDNHAAYYGGTGVLPAAFSGTELAGHPTDKWGFAVQGALSIKNIPTGPGDTVNMTAVYTDGASSYNYSFLFPKTGSLYGGSGIAYQGLSFFGISDTTITNGFGQESVKTWGFQGGYTHNWSPNWASSIYGSYSQLRYGTNAINTICAFARSAAGGGLTGACSPNVNFAVIGGTTVWTPVKNLAFTVDVNYTFIDQGYSGTIASPGNAGFAKPAAVYELKDQGIVTALFRAQRNF